MADAKGTLYKALSNQYGSYFEELDRLIVFDHQQSGNDFGAVENWYRGDGNRLYVTIQNYNNANPATRIRPRA